MIVTISYAWHGRRNGRYGHGCADETDGWVEVMVESQIK
jgi:hypothetical protein